nr:MAG TPA: hypothetical protein [Crassvirales sp.]
MVITRIVRELFFSDKFHRNDALRHPSCWQVLQVHS